MVITTLLIIKFIVTILFVLILSLLAEYFSPKVSGIISGIPTGTAIILFFYGLEQGTQFASESSVFNLVGMLSMQVFIYIYFKASIKNSKSNIVLSSVLATIGYLITIYFLKQIHFNILTALIIPVIFIPLFSYFFKKIENTTINKKVQLGSKVLFIRALIASLVVIVITGIAKLVGPEWAGLLSAFPTTLFPLILIIHLSYGKEQVHTIIKNVPKGQWGMTIYIVSLFFLYPLLGVYLGTIISYSLVILYLLILFKISR